MDRKCSFTNLNISLMSGIFETASTSCKLLSNGSANAKLNEGVTKAVSETVKKEKYFAKTTDSEREKSTLGRKLQAFTGYSSREW